MTPSQTPSIAKVYPWMCDDRPEGCAVPLLAAGWPAPVGAGAPAVAPLSPAPPVAALYAPPLLAAAAVLTLPEPPAWVETLTLSCGAAPEGAFAVAPPAALAAQLAPCPPSLALAPGGGFCVVLPAALTSLEVRAERMGGGAAPGAALTCTLRSTVAPPFVATPLPRYALATSVALPLVFAPSAVPLLAAVLLESIAKPGVFRVVGGGVDTARGLTVAPPPPTTVGALALNSTWASLRLPRDVAAANALGAALSPLRNGAGGVGWLDGAIASNRAHLLLLAAPGASLVAPGGNATVPAPPAVAINGVPCAVNWVALDGSLASVTTPPLAWLCGNATPLPADCGYGALVVAPSGDPGGALRGALIAAGAAAARNRTVAPLPLPAAYPPLLPNGADASAVGGGTVLYATAAAAGAIAGAAARASNAGLRLTPPCPNPGFAPPEVCAPVGGVPPPSPAGGALCGWGGGATACVPCPAGALCPGGTALLPLPGWFLAPGVGGAVTPASLVPCPEPSPEVRCPGWAAAAAVDGANSSTYAGAARFCAPGYRGTACATCAPRWFPSGGSCEPCPSAGPLDQFLAFLRFLGGLLGVGAVLTFVALSALRRGGGRGGGEKLTFWDAAPEVWGFVLWVWASAQCLASLFGQIQGSGSVPPALLPIYGAFTALQFKGVALPPECTEEAPFRALYTAVFVAMSCGVLVSYALCLRGRALPGGPPSAVRWLVRSAMTVAFTVLFVGYGTLVDAAASAASCAPETNVLVADYAASRGDGSALARALGAGAPAWDKLQAAGGDALVAQAYNLTALLRTTIPVSMLASDMYQPCREGPHRDAYGVGVALLVALIAVPLAGLCTLWCVGRLERPRVPCARGGTSAVAAAVAAPFVRGAAPPTPTPTPTPTPASPAFLTISAALFVAIEDATIRPHIQWWIFFHQAFTCLCAGVVALLEGLSADDSRSWLGYQGLIANAACVCFAAAIMLNPFEEGWRSNIMAALYGTAAVGAGVTIVFRFAVIPNGGAAQWTLGLIPLVCAAVLLTALIYLWYRSLVTKGARRGVEKGGGGGGSEALTMPPPPRALAAINPLRTQHIPKKPTRWTPGPPAGNYHPRGGGSAAAARPPPASPLTSAAPGAGAAHASYQFSMTANPLFLKRA